MKATASPSSFRTAAGLADLERVARARIAELAAEVDAVPAAGQRRRQSARERAVRERLERIAAAKATRARIEAERARRSDRRGGLGALLRPHVGS